MYKMRIELMQNKISHLLLIRDMWGPLSQIRVSLVASLGAGQLFFLAGSGAVENKVRYYIKREDKNLFR